MIPLTEKPSVVILTDPQGKVIASATNVAPDLDVVFTNDRAIYEQEAANKPFDSTRQLPPSQPLNHLYRHPHG